MFSLFGNRDDREESSGKNRAWLILIAAAVGAALILFGGSMKKEEKSASNETETVSEKEEMLLYQAYLEERVREICESVSGVSGVQVIVTLSGGFESVYATELSDGDEKYVIIGSGANAKALFLTREAPQIAGIGVVCHGGSDASIRHELTSLISASLRVPTNRIYVTESGQ